MNSFEIELKHLHNNSFKSFLDSAIEGAKSKGRIVFMNKMMNLISNHFTEHTALAVSEYKNFIDPALDEARKEYRSYFQDHFLNQIKQPKHYLSRSIWHDKLLDDPKYKKDVDDILYLSTYEARKVLKEKESIHPLYNIKYNNLHECVFELNIPETIFSGMNF